MSDDLIVVEKLSKKYCRTLKRSLWYGLMDIGRELTASSRSCSKLRKGEFWALKDVNFRIGKGELVGVIGPNGSGKTTLLKLLSGLIKPDEGSILVRGKVQALISLGAGFNPVLTGRENIYVNGAILGISKKEMDGVLQEIRDFSELGEFFDMPVQSYSSGMQVRLGFAVAVHLKPDILIVDEVLAVGDASFRRKARNKMMELLHSGISVLFVSHNMTLMSSLTSKCLYLDRGLVAGWGASNEMTLRYLGDSLKKSNFSKTESGEDFSPMSSAYFSIPDILEIKKVEVMDRSHNILEHFKTNDNIKIRLECEFKEKLDNIQFAIAIRDGMDDTIISTSKLYMKKKLGTGLCKATCAIASIPLREGNYHIGLYVSDLSGGGLFKSHQVVSFSILPEQSIIARSDLNHGCLVLDATWTIE